MATLPRIADLVVETTNTTGDGPVYLTGAVTGFSTFSSLGDGLVYYTIQEGFDKEIGIGDYDSSTDSIDRIDILATIVDNKFSTNGVPINLKGFGEVSCTINTHLLNRIIDSIDSNSSRIDQLEYVISELTGDFSGLVTKEELSQTEHNSFTKRDDPAAHPASSISMPGDSNVKEHLDGIGYQGEFVPGSSYAKKDSTWLHEGVYYVALKDTDVTPTNDGINWKADVSNHSELKGTDEPNCHPTSSITHTDGRTLEEIIQNILETGGEAEMSPYDFTTQEKEVIGTSLGYGGGTWHVFPTTMGRNEGGKSVIYHGTIYEAPEDKYSSDSNKAKGEAIISVKRVEVEHSPIDGYSPILKYRERGINKDEVSYLSDEHHQPAVFDNATTGQLIVGWGSRGYTSPASEAKRQHIRYGKDLFSLGSVDKPLTTSVPNYLQVFNTGNTVYAWSRNSINQWVYSKGAGGQNFETEGQVFLDAGAGVQYYLNNKYISSIECGGKDDTALRSRLHCFGQPHPTISPDKTIRYAMGTYITDRGYDSTFGRAGLIYQKPTDGSFLQGNGKLGEMSVLSPDDLEVAFTFPDGKTGRILDVQTGFVPRALLCIFDKTWSHGDDVPLGTTWDLVLIEFDEFQKQWRSMTIKQDLRGALGYRPWASSGGGKGVEGFTSFYATGACFYRGKNGYDVKPTIYLAHRIGDNTTQHKLTEINLDRKYESVSGERDLTPIVMPRNMVDYENLVDGLPTYKKGVKGSSQIIYRPDAIIGGDQRGLVVNLATGWSSYTSFTATDNLILLDYEKVAPTFTTQTEAITTTDGTKVRFGANVEVIGGETPEFTWQVDSGSGWTDIPDSNQNWRENVFYTAANGNKYRLKAETSAGIGYSDEILVTVS